MQPCFSIFHSGRGQKYFSAVQLVGALILCLTSPWLMAIEELDLLEDFGIEVFQTDPQKQAQEKERKILERNDALPPYILPETLAADAALDAVNLETPKEPRWTPVEHETALTAFDSQECCLRAIRASRYEVETKCRDQGHQVWQIESIPVKFESNDVIKNHRLCTVYHNDQSKKDFDAAMEKQKSQSKSRKKVQITPEFYRCRARSMAQCFNPEGENEIFKSTE